MAKINKKINREYENSLIKSTPWTPNPLDFEREETEVKKDIEWIKNKLFEIAWEESKSQYLIKLEDVYEVIDQLDEPEVLSWEWIRNNQERKGVHFFVNVTKLQNLLVPKQEEVDQAYKDGYEKGKEHASEKQTEETETVAKVLVDYLIAYGKLKLALKMEVEELEE